MMTNDFLLITNTILKQINDANNCLPGKIRNRVSE
jgi:hypothetical protein